MGFHDPAENITVLRQGKGSYGLAVGKGLESVFRTEAEIPVLRKGLSGMPYLPVMLIPPADSIGIVKGSTR